MDTTVQGVSSCRHCQFYKTEGRRGGTCHQLGVLVQGRWRACAFAAPLFAAPASSATAAIVSLQEALELETLSDEVFRPVAEQPDPASGLIASGAYPG